MSGQEPTGRRLGRIQGQLDDALGLLTHYATVTNDPGLASSLEDAGRFVDQALGSLEAAITDVNARAPRPLRPA